MKDANGGREYLVASTRGQRVGINDDQAGNMDKVSGIARDKFRLGRQGAGRN